MRKNKIFLVIPAHNEEKHIKSVLTKAITSGHPIILVDDGSTDKTFKVAKSLIKSVVRHEVNLGKGAALKTGSMEAFKRGAEVVIFLDSDNQHKIEDLPKFVTALNNGYDVVFGSRNLGYGVPLVRYLGNKIVSLAVRFVHGIYVSDILCGYKAMTKKAFDKLKWSSSGYNVETEIVIKTSKRGLKHCEVSTETVYLDSVKGLTVFDGISILASVIKWKVFE